MTANGFISDAHHPVITRPATAAHLIWPAPPPTGIVPRILVPPRQGRALGRGGRGMQRRLARPEVGQVPACPGDGQTNQRSGPK